jgi:hypothetical protein
MTKLLLATALATIAVMPAKACDWNRQASNNDAVVATTATPSEQTASQAATTAPQTTNVASERSASKSASELAPVVLITDRH